MGGGEYSILNLLKKINREKFQIIMVFNRRGKFPEKVEEIGIETFYLPFVSIELKKFLLPKYFFKNISAAIKLYKYLKIEQVNIVHITDVLSLLLFAIPARLLRIKVVYSVIFQYEFLRLIIFNLLSVLFVDKILTNSQFIKNYLENNTMMLSNKLENVYNGIDLNQFWLEENKNENLFRKEINADAEKILIGMAGRFDVWKGHRVFLEATEILIKKNKNLIFVIVGSLLNEKELPSIKKYYASILEYHRNMKNKERILFLQHRDDIHEVMRGLDILILPSYNEPFGLVVLEAMASGAIVIASDSGGPLEIIEHGKDGFFFKTGNVNSLVETINLVIELKDKEKIRASAYQKITRKYSLENYTAHMESIYNEIFVSLNKNNRN